MEITAVYWIFLVGAKTFIYLKSASAFLGACTAHAKRK